MKSYLYSFIIVVLSSFTTITASAQGCVAVRAMGGLNPMTAMGYTLPKGQFQIGTNYRYFHSFRHYVGTEEQVQRQHTGGGFDENGKEKGNAVNIYSHAVDLNISYGINDRLQVNLSVPYVHNERSQVLAVKKNADGVTTEGIRYSVYAQGLGDIRLSANYWVFDPKTAVNGNLSAGLGIKTNSGSHSRRDDAIALDPNTKQVITQNQVMDQAIQPGDGGIGFSAELQGFQKIYRSIYAFGNGYYLFNPRESNGTFKSAVGSAKSPDGVSHQLTGYNVYASPDQYFVRAGVMASFLKGKNMTASLAGRFEGIPANDVFGGQVAYRRPGYVGAIEYGLSYRQGNHSVGLFIPFNLVRNRIQSAADIASQNIQNQGITDSSKLKHVQGDAAFADYSINITYTYRIGKIFGLSKAPIQNSGSQAGSK
jgi:hypothetical protein